MDPCSSPRSLPGGDSPDLRLDHPTVEERTQIWRHYASVWGKALSLSQFLEECNVMLDVPLVRDGGMTYWILVDKNATPDERTIFSCCRTIRKRAVMSEHGTLAEGVVHGVAGVFCDPVYRGHGYARRMMAELATKLRTWQIQPEELCFGSILYSDIGTKFYSTMGWFPAPNNTHFEFPARAHPRPPGSVALRATDLGKLCEEDEILIREEMIMPLSKTRLAILADHDHMVWHHAKEEFVFDKIFNRKPELKGVMAGEVGKRVWAIWSHRLYCPPSEDDGGRNTLYILRLVIEKGFDATSSEDQMVIKANLEAIIQAAQTEAAVWNLAKVKLWNPSPLVEKLIEWTGIRYKRHERRETSVATLLWYGEDQCNEEIEWIANERYAWC